MQRAGASLMARPQLGRDVFARGAPEGLATIDQPVFELSLYELLKAYGDGHRRQHGQVLTIPPSSYASLSEALERLMRIVGQLPDWRELIAFLPAEFHGELHGGATRKSALAAVFAATLELAEIGPARTAPGPAVRADLPAQRRPTEGRMSERGEQLRLLEALLFAAPEPLSEEELGLRLRRRGRCPDVAARARRAFMPGAGSTWSGWPAAGLSAPRPTSPRPCAASVPWRAGCRAPRSRRWR